MKDWPKTIQSLMEYPKGCLGVIKISLAYIIRVEATVFPNPPGGYATWQQALIARAPILAVGSAQMANPFIQTYLDDRSKVWELLSAITRDLECWSYIMLAQKTRDGRSVGQIEKWWEAKHGNQKMSGRMNGRKCGEKGEEGQKWKRREKNKIKVKKTQEMG